MKKILINSLLAATFVISGQTMAETTLTVSSWASPKHGTNATVWPTWGQWIEKATEGRVKLNVVYDLAPPNSQMDAVADGVGDVTWLFHGFYPGRFSTTTLPEFPTFKNISSKDLSVAYWKTFDKYLKKANEYRGLVVVGVGVHGPGSVFTKDKVSQLPQLEGKRMRVGGGVMSAIAKKLKVAGVAMPPTGIYEAASQGVIDGSFLTLETLKSFRLAEVFPNTLTFPGGLYRGSFSIIVNADKWDEISPADQKAIMAVSGEKLSALFGQMMDDQDQAGIAFAKEKGNTITEADTATIDRAKAITADMPAQWLKDNTNKGFDAKAAMEFYKSQLQ